MLNRISQPHLTQLLKSQLAADPLFLIDVGCSGGVEKAWDVFGLNIQAVGFDPLVAEVERLRATETRPDFRYEAAFVGCHDYDRLFPKALRDDPIASRSNQSFARTSAQRAMNAMKLDYTQEVFNQGAAIKLADRLVEIDEYCAEKKIDRVDFIKVDTDGHDLEVLLGAKETMANRGVLGVQVECQLHGPVHPQANVFSNIDLLMREAGFTLFDLDVWSYTRGDLPGAFYYDITAQTHGGQVQWADAFYMRDLADPNYPKMTGFVATPGQLAKAACLLEFYGKADCAAELIVKHRQAFEPMADRLLDALTPVKGPPGIYRQYLQLFDADPTQFYASRIRQRQRRAVG